MATFSAAVNASSSLVSGDQHPTPNNLHAESLPLIDLRLLSQSELLSLSLCSSTFSSVHSLHSDTDLSTPIIDRSVFNESAGSRKQTFSRLRLAPRGTTTTSSHLASSASASTAAPLHRQISEESRQIVSRLKSLFGVVDSGCSHKNGDAEDNLVSVPIQFVETLSSALPIARMETANSGFLRGIEQPVVLLADSVNSGGTKRKRGRPRKNQPDVYGANCKKTTKDEIEAALMPNGNGVASEDMGFVNADDPNGDGVRHSSEGMQTKEVVLGIQAK
ncbi:Methyl-CpG-binding domain-containing protein 8 [Linum grandiflorum]